MRATDCRTVALLIAVLSLLPANAAPPPPIALGSSRVASLPVAFRFVPGARCVENRFHVRECSVPGYEVSGDPDACPPDAPFFGSITSHGAQLFDRFPETGAHIVARLHERQFICIASEAGTQRGRSTWSYVVAVMTQSMPDCRGVDLCRHADFPVHWIQNPPTASCRLDAEGRYTSGCAAGWVRSEQVDSYSMGIRPVGE